MNQKGFVKIILVIVIIIVVGTIGYFAFLKYTNSEAFTKKDIETLNKTDNLSKEEFKKACDQMSRFSYTNTGEWYATRTYYYKSYCYQELARRFEDSSFCKNVRERHFFFLEGSRVSEKSCLEAVAASVEASAKSQKNADAFNALTSGASKITKTAVEKISSDAWKISINTEGSLPGKYRFQIIHGDVSLSERQSRGVLITQDIVLKGGKENFNWSITREQIKQALGSGVERRLNNIAVLLTLIRPNNTSSDLNFLTSTGNVTVDAGQ